MILIPEQNFYKIWNDYNSSSAGQRLDWQWDVIFQFIPGQVPVEAFNVASALLSVPPD